MGFSKVMRAIVFGPDDSPTRDVRPTAAANPTTTAATARPIWRRVRVDGSGRTTVGGFMGCPFGRPPGRGTAGRACARRGRGSGTAASGPGHGQDQHVAGGERAEAAVEAGGHGQAGQDQGELAPGQHGEADVGRRVRARSPACGRPRRRRPGSPAMVTATAAATGRAGDRPGCRDRRSGRRRRRTWPRSRSRSGSTRRSTRWATDRPGHDLAGQEGADGLGHAELLGHAGHEDGDADEADREQLVVGGGRGAARPTPPPQRATATSSDEEGQGPADRGTASTAALGCRRAPAGGGRGRGRGRRPPPR